MDKKNSICSACQLVDQPGAMTPLMQRIDDGKRVILVVCGFPLNSEVSSDRGRQNATSWGVWGTLRETFRKTREAMYHERAEWGNVCEFYTYACRCLPFKEANGKVTPTAEVLRRCSAHTKTWIDNNRPSALFLLGTQAMNAMGFAGTTTKSRGSIFRYTLSDGTTIPAVVSLHPFEAFKTNPGMAATFVEDIRKVINVTLGDREEVEPDVVVLKEPGQIVEALNKAAEEVNEQYRATGKAVAVALDTETTSVTPYIKEDRVISISVSWKDNFGFAFPWEHRDAPFTEEEFKAVKEAFCRFMNAEKVFVVMANGKFDFQWLNLHYGLDIPYQGWDVMLAEHCLQEEKKGSYSLKVITRDRFPEYGHYEDELKEALDDAFSKKDEKLSEFRKEFEMAKTERILEWWDKLTDDERITHTGHWADKGWVDFDDASKLCVVKRTKRKGEMVVPKKYVESLRRMVNNVPVWDLVKCGCPIGDAFVPPKELTEKTFEDVDLDTLLWYGAMDALTTRKVAMQQSKDFVRDDRRAEEVGRNEPEKVSTKSLFYSLGELSLPLCRNLAHMEYNGVTVDRDKMRSYREKLTEAQALALQNMQNWVGSDFNPNANADVSDALFKRLGFSAKSVKKTDSGAYSVDIDSLNNLSFENKDREEVQFINHLLEYRKITKCLKTYIDNWLNMSSYDGRIHCSFIQIGTVTYRLSSSSPNLQNVPFRLKVGDIELNLKELFVPDGPQFDLYDADISNAEMRVLTGYSKDDALIDAFNTGKDLHCLTASNISDFTYDDILANKDDKTTQQYKQRQIAKKVNFGTIFGMSARKLQEQLWNEMRVNVTEEEAAEYLAGFFKTYPKVKTYMDDTEQLAKTYKVTYTYLGRRRRFNVLNYSTSGQSRLTRQAINARIQSTSSDLVMNNLNKLYAWLRTVGGRVLLTVHDSIVFQAPSGMHEGIKERLDDCITNETARIAPWLPVVWKYDCEWGPNYGNAHNKIS